MRNTCVMKGGELAVWTKTREGEKNPAPLVTGQVREAVFYKATFNGAVTY